MPVAAPARRAPAPAAAAATEGDEEEHAAEEADVRETWEDGSDDGFDLGVATQEAEESDEEEDYTHAPRRGPPSGRRPRPVGLY